MKSWIPSIQRIESANMTRFLAFAEAEAGITLDSVHHLYEYSIAEPEAFWCLVMRFCDIKANLGKGVLETRGQMQQSKWFSDTSLNFAENLLKYNDQSAAVVFWAEDKIKRTLSYQQLQQKVAGFAAYLNSIDIKAGDRVAAMMPNMPETLVAMLATTARGAIWTSCSADFGVSGVVDRFGQTQPSVLVAVDGYIFKGKKVDITEKVSAIARGIESVKHLVVVPFTDQVIDLPKIQKASETATVSFTEVAKDSLEKIRFEQLPFNHPLYIMYSSGTTGKPKCIVHGAGGTLLEHKKELMLHADLKKEDKLFYHTTCGWMMWNWLVSGLSVGATLMLYDGYPFQNAGNILWDYAEAEGITIFGTNAKYLSSLEQQQIKPRKSHQLNALKTILSTGSVLMPESFDYVYRDIKQDVCLSSIAGGTDIIGCFALGCPAIPVHRGELQMRSLGYMVEVHDVNGQPLEQGKGELVCAAPFPSMPICFWNDTKGLKYHQAYFQDDPNVWKHGDYIEISEHKGIIYYGRSDTTLNPSGVRIGTAEIYQSVERFEEIEESIVVGQDWQGDQRIVLFVKMVKDVNLTDVLKEKLRQTIRKGSSAFHVPKKILEVTDIPRTRSGKISEIAVKNEIHGIAVKNLESLANPEALQCFRDRKELDF